MMIDDNFKENLFPCFRIFYFILLQWWFHIWFEFFFSIRYIKLGVVDCTLPFYLSVCLWKEDEDKFRRKIYFK